MCCKATLGFLYLLVISGPQKKRGKKNIHPNGSNPPILLLEALHWWKCGGSYPYRGPTLRLVSCSPDISASKDKDSARLKKIRVTFCGGSMWGGRILEEFLWIFQVVDIFRPQDRCRFPPSLSTLLFLGSVSLTWPQVFGKIDALEKIILEFLPTRTAQQVLVEYFQEFHPMDLPETNSSPLKMDGWNTFLLGWPVFRVYVSFREGKLQLF